jgi:hypothetical protein
MKKILYVLLLFPFAATSQQKILMSTQRFFPKADKIAEFEKALSAHGKKFHTGVWKWKVYDILSGPDAGGYHVEEGPLSWTQLDERVEPGSEHNNDIIDNIAPLLNRMGAGCAYYKEELSSSPLNDFTEKISIDHVFYKTGSELIVEDATKKMKKAWENGKEAVAVFFNATSGDPQYIFVTRHKLGWKEKELGYRKPIQERYNAVNGQDSYNVYLDIILHYVDHSWSEMLRLRPELSSK